MVKIRRLVKQTFQTFLKLENINTSIQLDYELQNEKLKHFYSMLGVVKVNKTTTAYI